MALKTSIELMLGLNEYLDEFSAKLALLSTKSVLAIEILTIKYYRASIMSSNSIH